MAAIETREHSSFLDTIYDDESMIVLRCVGSPHTIAVPWRRGYVERRVIWAVETMVALGLHTKYNIVAVSEAKGHLMVATVFDYGDGCEHEIRELVSERLPSDLWSVEIIPVFPNALAPERMLP